MFEPAAVTVVEAAAASILRVALVTNMVHVGEKLDRVEASGGGGSGHGRVHVLPTGYVEVGVCHTRSRAWRMGMEDGRAGG